MPEPATKKIKNAAVAVVTAPRRIRKSSSYSTTLAEVAVVLYLLCLAGYDVRPILRELGLPTATASSSCCVKASPGDPHDVSLLEPRDVDAGD